MCLVASVDTMDYSPPGSSIQGFPCQEYWIGLPCPSPQYLTDPGIEPVSPACWQVLCNWVIREVCNKVYSKQWCSYVKKNHNLNSSYSDSLIDSDTLKNFININTCSTSNCFFLKSIYVLWKNKSNIFYIITKLNFYTYCNKRTGRNKIYSYIFHSYYT